LEEWAIHNMFNEDLLIQCVEPKFKGQHKEPVPPPTIINEEECCDNHLSQGQMITQGVNLLVRVSSGEFTRELDKEPLLN